MFRAPFYRSRVSYGQIDSVEVRRDDGMNPGYVNWPVLGRTRSATGARLNVGSFGGAQASLRVSAHGGAWNVTVVFPDVATARECAERIEGFSNASPVEGVGN